MQKRYAQSLAGILASPYFGYFLLAGITLLAFGLRFYRLGDWSFWGDEVFSIGIKEDGFNYSVWRRSLATDLIQLTTSYLGTSEWSARLVPAAIGVVTIPLLYFPLKRAINTPVALMTGMLLAVSTWHLYWSQNARFYSLLLLFYSLALVAFFIAIEEDKPGYLIVSMLLLALAARERLVALFFLPTIVGYLIMLRVLPFERPSGFRLRNLLLFFSPGSVGAFIFVGPYLGSLDTWFKNFGGPNNSPFWILSGVVYYVGLPIIGIAFFGAIYLLQHKNRAALFFGLAAIIPLVGMLVLSLFHYSANRYVFISLTSWLILASLALRELFTLLKKDGRILAAGILVVLLAASLGDDVLYYRFQNGNRPNWKAAFEYIQKHRKPGDIVVSPEVELGNYYLQERPYGFRKFDYQRYESSGVRVWSVDNWEAEAEFPETIHWIRKNAQHVADFDVSVHARDFKIRVYLYDPDITLTKR